MYTVCQNYFFSFPVFQFYSLPFNVVQIMFKEFFRIFFYLFTFYVGLFYYKYELMYLEKNI